MGSVPHPVTFQVLFTHAGETRLDTIHFDWFQIRVPDAQKPLWILVAEDEMLNRQLVLITNIPLTSVFAVQQVYNDWRLRSRVEHGYRFNEEQGLDVEDMRVQTVDRMRRLFAIVLLAAQIIFVISEQWPPKAVLWIRQLGGKLGIPTDRDGPYAFARHLRHHRYFQGGRCASYHDFVFYLFASIPFSGVYLWVITRVVSLVLRFREVLILPS